MSLRALIVDDEPVARRGIRARLGATPDIVVAGECGDGASAVAAIEQLRPDLVFLDIQMPEMDGFDVVATVGPARMPAVIFVTAFDRFALRAFEVHAVDYLLKPIETARFTEALQRVRARLAGAEALPATRIEAALAELGRLAGARFPAQLAIRGDGRIRLVAVADIAWAEAAGNYVALHVPGKSVLMRSTLAELLARLDPQHFVRVSRSALVRLDRVRELQPLFNGDFVALLDDGSQVTGSRRHREIFARFGAD